uniref:Uncharacterized protein n=1 Tax=Brassica oleracea var. oleracea TaxID=109376 RepID=A0A0D3CTC1_BRAOL
MAEENDGEPVDDLALMKRVQDEVSQLQTEDDASTASTNLSRFRINEIVESSVPKKKGRLVGLGRRTRSVPPSSAPPPFVDPEVLTAQLKDKDDRISLDIFLGIYRETCSSEYSEGPRSSKFSEGPVPQNFPMKIPRDISSELPRIEPSESPSKYPDEVLPQYIPRSFPTN